MLAEQAKGQLVYKNALSGRTLVHRPFDEGDEDHIVFATQPPKAEVIYDVTLDPSVKGLRLFHGTLELLDARGTPRLRMARPYIIGANKKKLWAQVAVSGCAHDTSARPPWNRPLTAPGATKCAIAVTWNAAAVTYPAVLDPTWSATSSMATASERFDLVALSDGRALAAGGIDVTGSPTVEAEIYDEPTGSWSPSAALPEATADYRSVRLKDGRVLLAGGVSDSGNTPSARGFAYDPATGAWSATGDMGAPRWGHAITLLPDGRVLATGGYSTGGAVLASTETLNPTSLSWTATAPMSTPRADHAAALLSNAWMTGGTNGTTILSSLEVYDHATDAWTTGLYMNTPRMRHTMTRDPMARLVVVGGANASGPVSTVEALDLSLGWLSAGPLPVGRFGHRTVLGASGRLVVTGGTDGSTSFSDAPELDPGTLLWQDGSPVEPGRAFHGAAQLRTGPLLVAGGRTSEGATSSSLVLDLETIDPQANREPPLSMSWTQLFGTQPSQNDISLTAQNRRAHSLTYTLTLSGRGLDGREIERSFGSFTVGGQASITHAIPGAELPVQSVGSESLVTWTAEITADGCGGCETLGTQSFSAPLYHEFDAGYGNVTLTGIRGRALTVGQMSTATTLQELATAMAPLDAALFGLTGRTFEPGVGYQDLSVLSPRSLDDSTIESGESHARDALADRIDGLWGDIPNAAPDDTNGKSFCMYWPKKFIDDGGVASGPMRTSFAKAWVTDATLSNNIVWSGHLDADGCTPKFASDVFPKLAIHVQTSLTDGAGRTVDVIRQPGPVDAVTAIAAIAPVVIIKGVRLTTVSPPAPTFVNVNLQRVGREANAAAVASKIMLDADGFGMLPGATTQITIDGDCGGPTACAAAANVKLGPNHDTPQTHNTDWRYVIAHEFGHTIQYQATGLWLTASGTTYGADVVDPGVPLFCRCDHVRPEDQLHCMQSREYNADGQREAFAHFIAARVWNRVNPSACQFEYYKPMLGSVLTDIRQPPAAVDCHTPIKWIENKCLLANRAGEWDWLNFFFMTNTASSNSISVTDHMWVYRWTCFGVFGSACSGKEVSFAQSKTWAPAHLSPDQEVLYRAAGFLFGVDH